MEKMKMESPDITSQNIEKIAKLFPNCVTESSNRDSGEGGVHKAVNFELLKQMLSGDIIEGDEAYEFTWVGKKASIVEANKPIRKTLRPCKEESADWDNTENLYIEGDNLEVLKLLQESYLGKVKMIYIDPPYNTGNDFIYNDNFKMSNGEYAEESGEFDDDGNRMFKNTDSNGRFHSDWCSMIYPRLMLARNLMAEDGVIFISIDDNEVDNLKKICDEVFGESNFISNIIWKRKRGRDNSARWFSRAHEYGLVYSKNKELVNIGVLELDEQTKRAYKNPDGDTRGEYRMLGCWARGTQGGVKYDFTTKDGKYFEERLWLFSKDNLKKMLEWGLPLSLPYSTEKIEDCTVHNYDEGALIACFDENIPESVIREIAKKKPLRAVFRDGSFKSSSEKINVGEIFKLLTPDTRVKVI